MTAFAPLALLLLALIPLLIGGYIWILRQRQDNAIRYSHLSLLKEALPERHRWRQHLPFALMMVGLAMLILGIARPAAEVEVPLNRSTIILALDVSLSMCATDVDPNRLTVAQEAALAFVEDQEPGTQIGLIAFAGFAELIVPPTTDKDVLRDALENLTTSLGTAIGSATLKSIDTIAEINDQVPPSGALIEPPDRFGQRADPFYHPEIVVLLTDGANSQGPPPIIAAERAAARQIRVYTIGFGTTEITDMVCTREQLGSEAFDGRFNGGGGFSPGGFGGGGFRRFLVIDEPTLQAVADITGGQYFRAENADQLLDVFLNLPSQIILQREQLELTAFFALLGALFLVAAVVLTLRWNRWP